MIHEQSIQAEGNDEYQHHLPSKQAQKRSQQNTYFLIPDAKPILSKQFVDCNMLKVLIREVTLKKQMPELINGKICNVLVTDKTHYNKQPKVKGNDETVWSKYMLADTYRCLYLKYYIDDLQTIQGKGSKKAKLQILKMCQNRQELFSTYLIDLSFLGQSVSSLQKNVKEVDKFEADWSKGEVQFDSKFESGNLLGVFEHVENKNKEYREYDLILQNDVNTKGYSNWFYFRVASKNATKFKFNIVNIQKQGPLYAIGMKVAVFSKQRHNRQGLDWHRDGYNYSFSGNSLIKPRLNYLSNSNHHYNCLSFCLDQKYSQDVLYIAANVPYSYSKMKQYIEGVEKIAKRNTNIYFKKQTVALSISQNECPVLTLTWKRDKRTESRRLKKIIGVVCRQHPCETVSSFVCQGFINGLIYLSNEYSVHLLKNYIFKIIPMANIDGVIYGNSRCDITGSDINRKWTKNPNKIMYPIVSGIKSLFTNLVEQGYELQYFLDLHGHSLKTGFFIYTCKTYDKIQSRELAWAMSKLNNKFDFSSCSFGLSQQKKETARGSMSLLVPYKKSMTVETSFYGYASVHGFRHFDCKDLHQIGECLIETLYADQTKDPKLLNWANCHTEIKNIIKRCEDKRKLLQEDQWSSGSDSDSGPQQDEIEDKQKSILFIPPCVAARIGLTDSKIIRKTRREPHTLKLPQNVRESIKGVCMNHQQNSTSQRKIVIQKPEKPISNHKSNLQGRAQIREPIYVSRGLPLRLSILKQSQKGQNRIRKSMSTNRVTAWGSCLKRQIKTNTKDNNDFMANLKKQYQMLLVHRIKQTIQK